LRAIRGATPPKRNTLTGHEILKWRKNFTENEFCLKTIRILAQVSPFNEPMG